MSQTIEERLAEYYARVTADVPTEGPGMDTVAVVRPLQRRRSRAAIVLVSAAAAIIVIVGLVVLTRSAGNTIGPAGTSQSTTPQATLPSIQTSTTTVETTTVVTTVVPASTAGMTASCADSDLLAALRALHPESAEWALTGVQVDACRNGYAQVVGIVDQGRCPAPDTTCFDNVQVWLHDVGGSWLMVDTGSGIGCADLESSPSIAAACAALFGDTGGSACAAGLPFVPTALPATFTGDVIAGDGGMVTLGSDGSIAPILPIDTSVRHYVSDQLGRYINIYTQAMPTLGGTISRPITVLGVPGTLTEIEDGDKVEFTIACGTYTLAAYGVSADDFERFVTGLTIL